MTRGDRSVKARVAAAGAPDPVARPDRWFVTKDAKNHEGH